MRQDYHSPEEEEEDGMWQGIKIIMIFLVLAAIVYPVANWLAGWWLEAHPN
ncbi:hypothetical protein SAMN06265337_0612 [Hymenobacter gelipurpurascens]|uniref:Uncharacterized protein n=1 Tax=Hymenobacter gelipurpurascens TaxID=89968 RepID=A0A212T7Y1_9BACT|nr:hypothetical protein [Hymenobacter gelipurpurascens]SNC62142.1 hypothetical protein SAMN06265337_0612 [Hymenobacter gelipurpurascens]